MYIENLGRLSLMVYMVVLKRTGCQVYRDIWKLKSEFFYKQNSKKFTRKLPEIFTFIVPCTKGSYPEKKICFYLDIVQRGGGGLT